MTAEDEDFVKQFLNRTFLQSSNGNDSQ